ncbi:MAG: AAA family ATPase, partial [Saprospiraceae bacterium]
MSTFPANSPFKLLNPYEKGDVSIYFGRENETRQLAEALMRSKFMLLYGASGTGKTSLIQCGLQGMFSPRDWLPIFVRRGTNFIESLRDSVLEQYRSRYRLRYPGKEPVLPQGQTLREAIKLLFNIAYVPVYLILDQFEEIFTLGDEAEQQAFFQALAELRLFEEDLFCKLLIVTREEYIAHFYRHEKELPFLFEYRFRVEKMRREQLLQVVEGTLEAPYPGYPAFRTDEGAPSQILDNLTDERGEIDLTTLQVYLDRLYQEDLERVAGTNRDHVVFDTALVGENKLQNVLSDFLDRQVALVNTRLFPYRSGEGQGNNAALQVLFKLVTGQGTKQNRSAAEIYHELSLGRLDLDLDTVERILDALAGADIRILNRLRFAKTDEERFELVHDRLAEQVFAKFNAEEISQREARTTIEYKQKRYGETKEYLSRGELELIGKSLNVGRLEEQLQGFYSQSTVYHKRRERRQRLVTIGSVAAAIVFALVAVFAYGQSKLADQRFVEAQKAQKDAQQKEQLANDNLRRFYQARYTEIVKKADNYLALLSPDYALWEYQHAQGYRRDTLQDSIPDSHVEKQIKTL